MYDVSYRLSQAHRNLTSCISSMLFGVVNVDPVTLECVNKPMKSTTVRRVVVTESDISF